MISQARKNGGKPEPMIMSIDQTQPHSCRQIRNVWRLPGAGGNRVRRCLFKHNNEV